MLNPYRKQRIYRGFDKLNLPILDVSPNSLQFFNITHIPTYFTAGKNGVYFTGNTSNLKRNSSVDFEVLDCQGNPVFCEINNYVDTIKRYILTIYIYPETPAGKGTLTLIGTANTDNVKWKNTYNVKWTVPIDIQPTLPNSNEIVFQQSPSVDVSLIKAPFYNYDDTIEQTTKYTIETGFSVISTGNVDHEYDIDSTINIENPHTGHIISLSKPSITTNITDNTRTQERSEINFGSAVMNNAASNTFIKTDQPFFTDNMIGGILEIPVLNTGSMELPKLSSEKYIFKQSNPTVPFYKGTILNIKNSTTALLDTAPTINYDVVEKVNGSFVGTEIFTINNIMMSASASISCLTPLYIYYSSSRTGSNQLYLDITYNNLNVINGDIFKIKAYYRQSGRSVGYQPLGETYIDKSSVLIDTSFPTNTRTKENNIFLLPGYFTTQSILEKYWMRLYESKSNAIYRTSSAQYDDDTLLGSVLIERPSETQRAILFTTSQEQEYKIGGTYELTFKTILQEGPGTIDVYMVSRVLLPSMVDTTTNAFFYSSNIDEYDKYHLSRFGKYLGTIQSNESYKYYDKIKFEFSADDNGYGRPLFVVRDGNWNLSEIEISSQKNNGFTPIFSKYQILLQTSDMPISGLIDYKFEYFDITGRQCNYVTYVPNVPLKYRIAPINWNCNYKIVSGSEYTSYYAISPDYHGIGIGNFNDVPGLEAYPSRSVSGYPPWIGKYSTDYTGWNINRPFGTVPSSSWITSSISDGVGVVNMACITRASVSSSMFNQANPPKDESDGFFLNQQITRRRLYWPAVTGSWRSVDAANQWTPFNTNGAIYNVKFKLYQDVLQDMYPDTGSSMLVYISNIFDVATEKEMSSYVAHNGDQKYWYPPSQNIVEIKNGSPTFTKSTSKEIPLLLFYDEFTGRNAASFELNVIQWGDKGRLVFEPYGNLASNKFFGICITDIEVCQIGQTYDEKYVKSGMTKQVMGDRDMQLTDALSYLSQTHYTEIFIKAENNNLETPEDGDWRFRIDTTTRNLYKEKFVGGTWIMTDETTYNM